MRFALHKFMEGLRDGGVYTTPDGEVVVARSEDDGSWVLYILGGEDDRGSQEDGRMFELFKTDAEGRLHRFGRRTDWRIADLNLTDTGETARTC